MRRLKAISAIAAFLIPMVLAGEGISETAVFGPAYVYKGKGQDKRVEFEFPASSGSGRMVIRNGGDSGKPHRVSSARVVLNGNSIVDPEDLNKNADVLEYNITLGDNNRLSVEMGSCNECELEVSVFGETQPARLPTR